MPRSAWVATWSAMSWSVKAHTDPVPRILVTRLGAMGDVIQTLPAVADLRNRFPEARIAWAVESNWTPILERNPHVDDVIPVALRTWRRLANGPQSWKEATRFAGDLRARRFDLSIDFQGLLKSAAIASLSGAQERAGFDRLHLREPLAELTYTRRVRTASPHVVDRYRDLAALVTGSTSTARAEFPLPVGRLRPDLPAKYVLASPQAGWGGKQWPAEHYGRLADRIWTDHRIPLAIDCPPGTEESVARIRANARAGSVVTHPSTISELIGATRSARAVVGVDSGPLHLAAALGRPGVAIFGPTDPDRNGPYGDSITVLRAPRAATTYKRDREPHWSMLACTPDQVYERIRPVLG